MTNWNILGTSDTTSTCELCGKKNLKKVVVIEDCANQVTMRVGCDCASYLTTGVRNRVAAKRIQTVADVVRLINKWMAKGFTAQQCQTGISSRGFYSEIKDSCIEIRPIVYNRDDPCLAKVAIND